MAYSMEEIGLQRLLTTTMSKIGVPEDLSLPPPLPPPKEVYHFPDDLAAWRTRLFDVASDIEMSKASFDLYWPYVDNIWSFKEQSKDGTMAYFRCRRWRKQKEQPLLDAPPKKRRKTREAIEYGMKIQVHTLNNAVVISRSKSCASGHEDTMGDADRIKIPSVFMKVATS